MPHSHNGFLDLAEELGAVGLVLFLVGMAVSAKCSLNWARHQLYIIGLWPLTYISFMFLFNLSEGSILRQDNLFWVLYVAATVFVVSEARSVLPTAIEQQLGNLRPPHIGGYSSLAYQKESVGS